MKVFLEIHFKLIATIWVILISVLSLLLLMNYMKFSSMMSQVVASQLQVISSSMQRSIIKAEQLGLPLSEMQNLPVLLQREQSRDPQIEDIFIIDSSGKLLFHSHSQNSQKSLLSNALALQISRKTDSQWSIESDTFLYSGLQLLDATEQLMGSIVIRYKKSGYQSETQQLLINLTIASFAIFSLFALLVFFAVRWGFADLNKVLQVINHQLTPEAKPLNAQHLPENSMAYQFAHQIKQREKMKQYVTDQINACCPQKQSFDSTKNDGSSTKCASGSNTKGES